MKLLNRVKESIVQNLVNPKVEYRRIKSIKSRKVEPVYNFSTSLHTYCVGENTVVHNCDTISMLTVMDMWKPSGEVVDLVKGGNDIWGMEEDDEPVGIASYVV